MKDVKKVFISLGLSGRNDKDIYQDIIDCTALAKDAFGKDVEVINNSKCVKKESDPKLYCLGEAIKVMSDCDFVVFASSWRHYKGCMVERIICDLYDIPYVDVR